MSFPGWTSEEEKLAELNKAAIERAIKKCKSAKFDLKDVYSNRWRADLVSPASNKVSAISANISCLDTAMTTPQVGVSNQPSSTESTIPGNAGNRLESLGLRPLKSCRTDQIGPWHECVGVYALANGEQFVGEYKNGQRSGYGVYYAADGMVMRMGTWKEGHFVSSHAVEQAQFPFVPTASTSAHQQVAQVDPVKIERDRLAAEVEAERKRRQELEQQLAASQSQTSTGSQASIQPAASARKAHALVIGNASYPGASRLQNPVNDAQGISDKLRSLGFVVTTVTDANRSRLLQALSQFSRSAATSDVSVLYYSGHGVQIDGTNYMLPTDIDNADALQATLQGVSLNTVVENFLPGKARLVFLDACRDNPLRVAGTRSIAKGLAPISVAQGTLIAYSTRDGQVALDGLGGRYSPFTQALIEHLSDPSDIGVVLRKVREKVMQRTNGRQQPWEYGSLTGGELVLSAVRKANQ